MSVLLLFLTSETPSPGTDRSKAQSISWEVGLLEVASVWPIAHGMPLSCTAIAHRPLDYKLLGFGVFFLFLRLGLSV